MKLNPDISFIIVNYDGIAHTTELVQSVDKYMSGHFYEIVVVDNGSKNNESLPLSEQFPKARIIRSDTNLGFSGGNNLGIKASSGRYVMLINNDALLCDDSICQLAKMLDEDPAIGAASPKIQFLNPPKTIQYAGYTELTRITLRNRTIGYNELDNGQYDIPAWTASTHGAAMMIRRDVIERVGYMPEIYFLYYEEFDWCAKIRALGYKLMYQPASVVLHKDSQSTGNGSPLKIFYMTRNRLLFAYRNRKGIIRFLSVSYLLLVAYPKQFLLFLLGRKKELAMATLRGVCNYFKMDRDLV